MSFGDKRAACVSARSRILFSRPKDQPSPFRSQFPVSHKEKKRKALIYLSSSLSSA